MGVAIDEARNAAAQPGAITVLGTPIDPAKVGCDSFCVAGYTDHITPWRACYGTAALPARPAPGTYVHE